MGMIPPLGASGLYQLKAPFQAKLRSNVTYRCAAIRRFNDVLEEGDDPYAKYYQPEGIAPAVYQTDSQNSEAIVSLVSEAQHWVHVPTSFIESFPNQGGIPYQALVLGVPLGPVPTYMDLSGVQIAIQNIVRDMMGITVQANYVSVSEVQNLKQEDHDRIEASRANALSNAVTDRAKYVQILAAFQELQLRNKALEEYIRVKSL